MRLHIITLLGLILIGFTLRLYYLVNTHPFFDEYTTVLAARQILDKGGPILPSGLFYEHGLLATYLITPFTALFINMPPDQWQPAHWGLMLSRWPSLIVGTLTIPLIFAIGRRINYQSPTSNPTLIRGQAGALRSLQSPISNLQSPISNLQLPQNIALLAAGLFALSPEGMVWGGRARMYALATFLVLLTVYWAYRGAVYPAPARYRRFALAALLAALLTQFGVMMLIPPLIIGMLLIGWLSHHLRFSLALRSGRAVFDFRFTFYALRVKFLRKTVLLEGFALAAIITLVIWVKRLGRPMGFAALPDQANRDYLTELFKTISYQTAVHFTWDDTLKFLARQFGVPHHVWLLLLTIIGLIIGLGFWWVEMRNKKLEIRNKKIKIRSETLSASNFQLFLCTVFFLVILEMVTLLDPFRRNPRYIVMYLPLFYLIAARAIFNFRLIAPLISHHPSHNPHITHYALRITHYISQKTYLVCFIPIILLLILTSLGLNDLWLALVTPEPAYEEAFAYIQANRQPGDILLTMNTPAAHLYLSQVDGFTIQNQAGEFLLDTATAPIDRWVGAPWVGTMAAFNQALNNSRRAWFVTDTIRQPVYFRGDWQAVVNSQMELVWSKDNALIYRTRPVRRLLPVQPERLVHANLDHAIELIGYTLDHQKQKIPLEGRGETYVFALAPVDGQLALTLFWQPLVDIPVDYTTFLHLRNKDGLIVAQQDSQPLAGGYPTSHWQPNEMIIDPMTLSIPKELPPGTYRLMAGLYRLDTLARLPVVGDESGENAILLGEVSFP